VNLGFDGKVALVCGSSRGLGRAFAAELAREGCALALCARGAEALERTVAELETEFGASVLGVSADLGRAGEATRVVEACLAHYGRLDILVTNTGGPPAGGFDDLSASDWQQATALLLDSVVELIAAALPGMRERHWGRILAITSITARQPVDNLMLSNAIRPAVAGLAHSLAREVARDGITVNTILPGFTNTERMVELYASDDDSPRRREIEASIPIGRLAEPEEFAALAAFLVSERAGYLTGASFAVDGGWISGV
jgi:3-oxoacyl-[acyl-carrier protein] reductase